MDEKEIKSFFRMWALESLVTLLFASIHKQASDPDKSLDDLREKMLAKVAQQTFPNLQDAALSDFASAELESAIARLIDWQRHWLHSSQ